MRREGRPEEGAKVGVRRAVVESVVEHENEEQSGQKQEWKRGLSLEKKPMVLRMKLRGLARNYQCGSDSVSLSSPVRLLSVVLLSSSSPFAFPFAVVLPPPLSALLLAPFFSSLAIVREGTD